MGLGMSNELDSSMAAQTLIWAYGASVQDADENVIINSPETIAAVDYMAELFKQTMTAEVFGWNPASNNQLLVAGHASYILNSISAYRTAQTRTPTWAPISSSPRRSGTEGRLLASEHAIPIYVVPKYAKNPDAAKEFLLHLVQLRAGHRQSELYNFPAWPDTVPDLDAWLDTDPFGSEPADKLSILKDAPDWTTNLGHPGPANAAMGEIFAPSSCPT